MKIKLLLFVFLSLGIYSLNAQKVVLKHKISASSYVDNGEAWVILGEITNNSGKMVRGVSVNVNYFDASGKKLAGSNFLTESQKDDFSDSQASTTDYLAKDASVPFYFIRFADKINGKVARAEVVVNATPIQAKTAAIIENVKAERILDYGTTYYHKVTGNIKCTGAKCYNCSVIIGAYDEKGNLVQVSDYTIENADELNLGQTKNFEVKIYEDKVKFAKVKAFPSYRGDWDEE